MKAITLLFSLFFTVTVFAESTQKASDRDTFYQDNSYVYQVSPYKHILSDEKASTALLKTSAKMFTNLLKRMVESGSMPKEVFSVEDLKKLEESEKQVDVIARYLNEWIVNQKTKNPYNFDWMDLIPDALMIYGGAKGSVGFGASAGAALNVGLIIMPVYVTRINKATQETTTYTSVKMTIVGIPNVDVGAGAGGGANTRIGVGLLWATNNQIVDPSQFVGAGLGVSGTVVASFAGVNIKIAAMAFDTKRPYIDFIFAGASYEFGLAGAVEFHGSASTFISGEKLLSIFSSENGTEVLNEELRKLEKELNINDMAIPDQP